VQVLVEPLAGAGPVQVACVSPVYRPGRRTLRARDERQRRRFSQLIADGLADPRLRALMSMRVDFFSELRRDQPLYAVHRLISVPLLCEATFISSSYGPSLAPVRC
jgi:hypothetical protein